MSQTASRLEKRATTEPVLADIVREYMQQYEPARPHQRHLSVPSGGVPGWIRISYEDLLLPAQGWKLHIAASNATAEQTLHCVLPILLARCATFKLVESTNALAQLNEGLAGLSQIGKFLTVYPRSDEEAIDLARALDEATRELHAPAVPSDRPLYAGSIVHYRYGGFQPQVMQTAWGSYQLLLQTPDHELIADQRTTTYTPPAWATDPFLAAGIASELPSPKLFIGERYLLLTTLHQSAQSQVHLAADLLEPRRCMVKHPGLAFVRGTEHTLDPMCSQLRHEASVLQALAPHPGFPAFYDLVEEQGETLLIMEDMEGETLEVSLRRLRQRGLTLPLEQLIAWGKELAALLAVMHSKGLIHRDIKSTNIMVAPDNSLRLLDFGFSRQIGSEAQASSGGTFGYMSPQHRNGEPARISDDIYALGAVLYFLATGAEPSLAPYQKSLNVRPLTLLNPHLPADLASLIERCLAPDLSARFASALEIERALSSIQLRSENEFSLTRRTEIQQSAWQMPAEHYHQLARRLGETLCQVAQPDPESEGLRWRSTAYVGKGMYPRDVNMGNAGTLLALAELVDAFQVQRQRDTLVEGARWLAASHPLPGERLAGLYIGESGIGAALLRAGQVLDDPDLISLAMKQGYEIAQLPFRSPDLFNGTAGRIRYLLWLWDTTKENEMLSLALQAGQWLVEHGEETNNHELYWRIPSGYGGMSGKIYPGYAHGAAGIADVLLDLYEATQQEMFLTAALRAGRWLQRLAIPVLADQSGLDWPASEGEPPHGAHWCHGATGIGSFFLHLAQLDVFSEAFTIAQRAARTVAYGSRTCSPVLCHGLSGNIEFLLDMFQKTKDTQYQEWAFELAALMEAFAQEKDGLLTWPSEVPLTTTPDYQVGYAGVAVTLLRLGDMQRPRQLSREGFAYQAHTHNTHNYKDADPHTICGTTLVLWPEVER